MTDDVYGTFVSYGAGDCVNVCLCRVRICQKVYVIAGTRLLEHVLGGLCVFASFSLPFVPY